MSTDTQTTETTTVAKAEKPAKVAVIKIGVPEAAEAIAKAFAGLVVQKTESKNYRILGTEVDTDLNWKKGLIYQVYSDASNIRLEMQLYSAKKGAHLVEFVPRFNQFNGAKVGDLVVEQAPKGLATLLRIKLPYALGLEGIAAAAAEFLALVNPEVEAVRALVPVAPKKEKKAKKAKAEKVEAPSQAKKAKSKTKTKPVAKVAEATAPLNPEVVAAIEGIQQ